MCVCVCVCVFSSHLFWASSSLDVPGGVTREESHTGFIIHLPPAARALIFIARRIQSSFSLVDREVEFCVHQRLNRFPLVGHFFFFFCEKNPVYRGSNSRPNVSEGYEVTSELPGRPARLEKRKHCYRPLFSTAAAEAAEHL